MDSFRYSKDSLTRARDLYALLAGRVRMGDYSTLTYGQAARALGFHHRAMRYPLAKIQDECRAANRPTLTVLIVDGDTQMPNEGCDAFGERNVDAAMQALRGVDWPAKAWW